MGQLAVLERIDNLPISYRAKNLLKQQVVQEARKRLRQDAYQRALNRRYAEDPVAFGTEMLGETFTEDIIAVLRSVQDSPVTLAKSANAVGKTHAAARVAIHFFKVYRDSQVYTTALPFSNLKRQLWGEIDSVVAQHPKLFKGDRVLNMHIERRMYQSRPGASKPVKSFITGVAIPQSGTAKQREAKFSGKHAPFILFIVDEGDTVPPEIYDAIESSMSGGFARLLIMFNPKFQFGPIYDMEREETANVIHLSALSHPNVVTGTDVIPGAVTRDVTVRRIHKWTRPLMEGETVDDVKKFVVPDFLVGAVATTLKGEPLPPLPPGVRVIMVPEFSYMVAGEYPAEGATQLIPVDWINQARARYDAWMMQHGEMPPVGIQPIMGQDVAEYGTDRNATCFRYGTWVAPFHSWNGIDPDLTAINAADLYKQYDVIGCGVDATGVGAGVPARMERLGCDTVAGIKVASSPTYETEEGKFYQLRDQLYWRVREFLDPKNHAMIPDNDQLVRALQIPQYRKLSNGKIKITEKDIFREYLGGESPDFLDALALTFADIDTTWVMGMAA